MKRGAMISFSGIDSSGKTTYINLLKDYFKERRIKYKVVWSRGGYTSFFEAAKKFVRFVGGKKIPESGHSEQRDEMFKKKSISKTWYVLALLDLIRLYAFTFRIYKLLRFTIICDRYIWDTYIDFCFQFSEDLVQKSLLWKMLTRIHRKPDVSLFLYVSPEESLRRSIEKQEPFSEPLEKRTARMELYFILNNDKKWNFAICTEHREISSVWQEIKEIVDNAIF